MLLGGGILGLALLPHACPVTLFESATAASMTQDVQGLVAALVAAKDIEALESAIAAAAALDQTPGEDKQKLRGAGVRGRAARH